MAVLPLSKWCRSAAVTLACHTLYMCALHLNRWRDFARVLPHVAGRMHGGKQQKGYGDLVNDMKVGSCFFSSVALLAVCIPGVGEA